MARLLERPRATLALLILIAVSLITVSFRSPASSRIGSLKNLVSSVVDPTRGALDSLFRPLSNAYHGVSDYPSTLTQLQRAQAQIQSMRRTVLEDQGAIAALDQLSRLSNLPWAGTIASTPAQVIGVTPSNLQLSFEINRGTSSGVGVGNPVVGGEGLVGRVIQVTSSTATVLMLTDPSSVVGVRIAKTGQVGALTGQGSGLPLSVDLVVPGTPLKVGTVLFTSGLQGEIFPPGIPAGRVTAVSNPAGNLQESITVAPLCNYQNLQFVSVLKWLPGGGS